MATIAEVSGLFRKFADEFEGTIMATMDEHRMDVIDFIQEQLITGMDGEEKPLRPTYSDDPYFNSDEAGKWKGRAKDYAKWKKKITPPVASYLGMSKRDDNTPNLIITGVFYSSITATKFEKGLRMETKGTPMGEDIERKYGSSILKPGHHAVRYFNEHFLRKRLDELFRKYGMR